MDSIIKKVSREIAVAFFVKYTDQIDHGGRARDRGANRLGILDRRPYGRDLSHIAHGLKEDGG